MNNKIWVLTFSVPPKDPFPLRYIYHNRNDLTFCKSINPRKQYPPTKQDISQNFTGTSEWVAQLCISHPSTDTTQSQLLGKNQRCKPQTCLHPFPVNEFSWCYCQPLLTLLPARPVSPKHWAGSRGPWQEDREEKKMEEGWLTFHSVGQCIPVDSCHKSADHQTPDNRSGRICAKGGPHTLWGWSLWN